MNALSSKLLTARLGSLAAAAALLLSFSGSVDAQELMLTKGTKSIGGRITVDINYDKPKDVDGTTIISLNSGVNLGYFLADNIRASLSLGSTFPFNTPEGGASSKTFSAGVGADYYFAGMGRMVPFIGGRVGISTQTLTLGDDSATKYGVNIGLPVGVLFPLSSHVALSLGADINFNLFLNQDKGMSMNIPIGFLGVEAFF